MKKKIWNQLIYGIITKTIKKNNIRLIPNKTNMRKTNSLTPIYENPYLSTNNNDISKIYANQIGIFNDIVGI